MHFIFRHPAFLMLAYSSALIGGELKVDINRDTKNTDTYTEVGFTKWSQGSYDGATTSSGTTPITRTFTTASGESLSISFAQTAASQAAGGTGITFLYNNAAASGSAKLIGDGLTVAPSTFAGGGQLTMSITGLEAGEHSLLTYHNGADGGWAAGSVAPLDVYVNGSLVHDDLAQTVNATSNVSAASSYVTFSVGGTTDVTTILFDAEAASGSYTIGNPMINGFEIDTPDIYRSATMPSPADEDWHVDADSGSVVLSWTAALAPDTASHDVYFGTDFLAVKNADHSSAEYVGNQTSTSHSVAINDLLAAYYWRIDEVSTSGDATAGTVWAFRPRVLAFPGAEGYGRFARGGRGGNVVHVTSLADYPAGSPISGTLRYAVEEESGPRTIVFDVSGLITLTSRLTLSDDNISIAGQTAPGKGICIRGYALGLSGSDDSIVRFIRNRPGDISGATIDGGGLAGCNHSIMDHCSISWSIDEAFSGRSAKNITLQNTLISEALNIAGHQNYPPGTEHGYAATISGGIGSYHHNLLAHCEGRNWSLGGGLDASGNFAGQLDIRNNVVYNWGNRTTDGGAHEVNFVNNYYKTGAASTIFTALNAQYDNFPGTQQYYMAGNVMPGYFTEANQSAGRTVSGYVPTTYPVWVSTPFFDSHVTTHTASQAYRRVLSDVGCAQPLFDSHDQRVVTETRTGTYSYTGLGPFGGSPGLPNSQDDVGGWETYPAETRSASWDSDGDGLPSWWETIHSFNPTSTPGDLTESHSDADGDGRTALEDYLDWIAQPHGYTPQGAPLTIDLRPLAQGFDLPTFSVASATHGSALLSADGKHAIFTPTSGYTGLAELAISITGNGVSMSRTLHIAVSDDTLLQERRWQGSGTWNATTANWWSGSLLCVWQAGNAALFSENGDAAQLVSIASAIDATTIDVQGNYRFAGPGSALASSGIAVSGTAIFSGSVPISTAGTWGNTGTIDLIAAAAPTPTNINNLPGGKVLTADDLRISNTARTGTSFTATMHLPIGHSYTLQKSLDLATPWADISGQTHEGNNADTDFTDTSATSPRAFYRIRVATP